MFRGFFKHLISARIRIIQITAHAVIIPVKCQRFCLVAEVAVFGEEGRRYHAVVPCPQILALDIRIVGFSVVGVFVLILRSTEGDLSGDAVTVGLVDLSLFIGDARDASPGIIEIISGAAIEPVKGGPVESAFYLLSVDIYEVSVLPLMFCSTSTSACSRLTSFKYSISS